MKKLIILAIIVALIVMFVLPATLFAHPKGPSSMPAQSLNGTHKAVYNVPEFPHHILLGLMRRTDLCHKYD